MTQDNMNFTTGSIFRKLIGFMMPILGALLLQTMYGAVDILVVGWFGTDVGISAVSTGSSFINMIVFILNGLAMGVTVLMGRYIGEKNEGRLGKVIGGAIVTFLAIAAVMTVLLLVFAPGLSTVMQAPKDAIDKTIVYIRICGGGIVFIIGYNLISSIFRGIGNSSGLIFRIRNCKQNRSSCNAGSICSDAVNVIFHRTECRRRERKAGAEIDGIWYADRWLHRNCHDSSCIFRWTVPCIFLYG